MALTPEDVINKRFQPTKFREGYDQDEVDDFLDEIVVELRNLNTENADLKKQLEAAGAPAEAQPSATDDAVVDEPTSVEADTDEASVEEEAADTAVAQDEEFAPAPTPATVNQPADASAESAQSAAGVLVMAQKLHDDLVAQGQSTHDRLVEEGRLEADQMLVDAQRSKDEIVSGLEQERGALEQKVDELKSFEQNYRDSLKQFISGHLTEIESAPPVIEQTESH